MVGGIYYILFFSLRKFVLWLVVGVFVLECVDEYWSICCDIV